MGVQPKADILLPEQVAAWLCLEKRQLERYGVPRIAVARKTVLYLRSDVLKWLDKRRRTA